MNSILNLNLQINDIDFPVEHDKSKEMTSPVVVSGNII